MSWTRIMVLGFCFTLLCGMGAENGYAQVPDSCFKLLGSNTGHVEYDSTFRNPDSIYIDSCLSSPTYLHRFAKQWYSLQFKYGTMLRIPAGPLDTTINVEWTQIDTSYSATRAGFDTLQQKFTHFILHKSLPEYGDTSDFNSNDFDVKFDSLVDIDSVINQMLAIPMLAIGSVGYENRSGGKSAVPIGHSQQNNFIVKPNPAFSEISITGSLRESNRIQIFSFAGELVAESVVTIEHAVVNISALSSGIFFLKINEINAGSFLVIH